MILHDWDEREQPDGFSELNPTLPCLDCGSQAVGGLETCFGCQRRRTHAAFEEMIRQADQCMQSAQRCKQAVLDAQWQLLTMAEGHR